MGALVICECTGDDVSDKYCPTEARKGAILIDAPPVLGEQLGPFLESTRYS